MTDHFDGRPPGQTPPPYEPPEQGGRPGQPGSGNPAFGQGNPAFEGDQPRRGQIRRQDPDTTVPRPPTLAEQRARQNAERDADARRKAELAYEEGKRKRRRRLLIGGGATAGLVAIVAIWYSASQPDEVTAYCVADDDVVYEDDNCDENYVRTSGGYYSGGFFYVGGRQYHYHYGGNPTPIGSKVSGGSTVRPAGANITTRSGKSIQRGGFGIRGGSGKS